MAELDGINLAMQTPMHADGSIDYARWEALIDVYIDAGVHGLVLGAGTGQHPYLTQEECNRLYELGARRIDGRCNLICQTSALVVDEVIERSRHAQGLGADALMILPPYLEGPEDDDGLFEFYRSIDAVVEVDIVGYNIPQTTGIGISVELFKNLRVLNGCDPNTVFAFIAGAQGCIWGGANYMPRECVQLYDLVVSGNHVGAMRLWQRMIPSLLCIWRGQYIAKVKAASRLRGFDAGSVRAPLHNLDAVGLAELEACLETLNQD
jgi:4-hydroxy-tetrahydrodipicolinate synthase